MPRIAGINIPENKHIVISLTYIYGIGKTRSEAILKETGIPFQKKCSDLTADELGFIREKIEKNMKVEGDLRRSKMMDIKRLKDIRCWRGNRHQVKLPTRGQRTKTNSRTVRGNVKKTVGSGRKKATK
jgi:small subunit ribosomal protein S13